MSKKGSALMQVLVIGLIVAAFSVLMLRYAVTRSANMSITERNLEMEVVADSCLEQYMGFIAYAELRGTPPDLSKFNCRYYKNMTATDLSSNDMSTFIGNNDANKDLLMVGFKFQKEDVE